MAKIETYDFKGKRAIVRVDFNVPLNENGQITDDTRIRGALPTLKKVLADGGSLIIMSHMGKPKGKVNAKFSLSQIVDAGRRGADARKPPFLSRRGGQTRRYRQGGSRLRGGKEGYEGFAEGVCKDFGFVC